MLSFLLEASAASAKTLQILLGASDFPLDCRIITPRSHVRFQGELSFCMGLVGLPKSEGGHRAMASSLALEAYIPAWSTPQSIQAGKCASKRRTYTLEAHLALWHLALGRAKPKSQMRQMRFQGVVCSPLGSALASLDWLWGAPSWNISLQVK